MGNLLYSIRAVRFSLIVLLFLVLNLKYAWSAGQRDHDADSAIPLSSLVNSTSDAVHIHAGMEVYIDRSLSFKSLMIDGHLHCDAVKGNPVIELRVEFIVINGTFQCGKVRAPYKKKLILSLKHSNIDPKVDPKYRGIMVASGGKLLLSGNRAQAGWVKLRQTAMPGSFIIKVEPKNKPIKFPPNRLRTRSSNSLSKTMDTKPQTVDLNYLNNVNDPWRVGDTIAIGPTGFDPNEAESFKITHIDPSLPNDLHLDKPLQFMHWGQLQFFPKRDGGTVRVDERAEVANLTRSILIRPDERAGPVLEDESAGAQRGAHIMIHHGGFAAISGVELYKMGQAGVMARYPFHWHHVGDAAGQFVKNSSIHHTFQRCITIHRTNKVLLQNNVCYNFKGHGYFLEDGTEVKNKIIKNLAIKATGPSPAFLLLASDDIAHSETQGRFPSVSAFWISNPDNFIRYNVVSGSVGTGFWMAFEDEVKDTYGNVVATPITTKTDSFDFNTAHSTKVGMTWDGAPGWKNVNNPNNPNDFKPASAHYLPPDVPVFRGLKIWKNSLTGIYFRSQTTIIKNLLAADNGWALWNGYNQILRDSIIIGKTNNTSSTVNSFYYDNASPGRRRKTGVVLYDGPFEVHDTEFLNFSTTAETYTKPSGQVIQIPVVPFTSIGGTSKFTNFTSNLKFHPDPIYRMHLLDASDVHDRHLLGTAAIRDLDGSLSGAAPGSLVVSNRSLGFTNSDNCIDAPSTFHNFKICPPGHIEGGFAFMRWGGNASPWGTHFIIRRSDGALSMPISEWGQIAWMPHNFFFTTNSSNYIFEILPRYQYEYDRDNGVSPRVNANSESNNPITPIIKFVAYGKNCILIEGAVKMNSLAALYSATEPSYYTDGADFYMRIVPNLPWRMITDSPLVTATANRTATRYPIACDAGYLATKIKGQIQGVVRTNTDTTFSGWACDYTQKHSINVKAYAYGPPLRYVPVRTRASFKRGNRSPSSLRRKPRGRRKVHTLITQVEAKFEPDANIAYKCGKLSHKGRKFSITIPNIELRKFYNHKLYIKGIPNPYNYSNSVEKFINGSGVHNVYPIR